MKAVFALATATTLIAPSALAQGAPAADAGQAPPAAVAAVPEATLRAVKDRRVTLVAGTQGEFTGKVLAVEPDSVTIARDDGEVVTIPRALLTHVRLAEIDRVAPSPPPPAPPPPRPAPARTETEAALETPDAPAPKTPVPAESGFAAYLNAAAGIAVDGDYKHFHAFASTAFLFPLVSSGQLFAGTAGAGATFLLNANWHFDLFAHVAPMFFPGANYYGQSGFVALGVGFGFRYLASSGWCIGIKLPLLGAAAGSYPPYNNGVGLAAAYYYLASAISLPVFSVGYRF